MSISTFNEVFVQTRQENSRWYTWFRSWEVYLLALVAGFLRFYQLYTTEFDQDQAILFRMAHDALLHHLLPATSNSASIGFSNPGGVIYLFMLPALISPDPLGGAILVSIFTTTAVLLTYFFTRRYYGRFAATLTAFLYGTAAKPLLYARFIWQPNVMPPFVLLFFFALFFGAVERRKGWLLPALLLLGVLYQMHEVTLVLIVPLVVAILLAPNTVRVRDFFFAFLGLIVLFFPYLLWEITTHFTDIKTLLSFTKQHAHLDGQALHLYMDFLIPFGWNAARTARFTYQLRPFFSWLHYVMPLLVLVGMGTSMAQVLLHSKQASHKNSNITAALWHWWMTLRTDPFRCGLVLLIVWQFFPFMLFLRHSIDLHPQYFFLFMPGPFIVVGLFLAWSVHWLQARQHLSPFSCFVVYGLSFFLIAAQIVGSGAWVLDATQGNMSNDVFKPYHNDLASLQHALQETDQLAQARHLHRVYIAIDEVKRTALEYLSEQMKTPVMLFDAAHCLVLPDLTQGPALLLVGPHDDLTEALVQHFTDAKLLDSPARLGGPPFHVYLVPPSVEQTIPGTSFTHNLQVLDPRQHLLDTPQATWSVTRWRFLRSETAQFRTSYGYVMTAFAARPSRQKKMDVCTFTAIHAGDQLLVAFEEDATFPRSALNIQVQSFTETPHNPVYYGIHLETDTTQSTEWKTLHTLNGKTTALITLPLADDHVARGQAHFFPLFSSSFHEYSSILTRSFQFSVNRGWHGKRERR